MGSVAFFYCFAECRYDECRYDECRYAECRYDECRYDECRSALQSAFKHDRTTSENIFISNETKNNLNFYV
jgi:hypothetical protein